MRAAVTPRYGSPDVLEIRDVPRPTLGAHDVLVEVHASPVTAGDRRLRAADFPSISAVPGRLMMGVLRPRNPVQGSMFAGRVVEVGSAVTRYTVGDDVFGSTDHGAYAELLVVAEEGPMAPIPAGFGYAAAAAVPYGAYTALHFLRDLGEVKPGQKVLVVGASGGVGRYAVQIARHLGAEVTAVCSAAAFDLVRDLGAEHVIDRRAEDFTRNGQRYDVIFDIADATSFGACRSSLTPEGRYLTLFVSPTVLLQMAWTSLVGGQRALFAVALGSRDDMETLRDLLAQGVLRPTIAGRYPLERIAEAHAVSAHGVHGEVIVSMAA